MVGGWNDGNKRKRGREVEMRIEENGVQFGMKELAQALAETFAFTLNRLRNHGSV